ncbi:hypothetical protein Tco_1331735 [Tanacetum coccineum]
MSKDVEPSRGSKSKESKSSFSKDSKSQSKSFGKSAQAEEPVFETTDTEMPLNQGDDWVTLMINPMMRQLQGMTGSRNQRDLRLQIQIGTLQNQLILDLLRLGSAKLLKHENLSYLR